jgi:hypothetical protein
VPPTDHTPLSSAAASSRGPCKWSATEGPAATARWSRVAFGAVDADRDPDPRFRCEHPCARREQGLRLLASKATIGPPDATPALAIRARRRSEWTMATSRKRVLRRSRVRVDGQARKRLTLACSGTRRALAAPMLAASMLAVAGGVVAPAPAVASHGAASNEAPLLSGYGGPGAGQQVVLGSEQVGGSAGGSQQGTGAAGGGSGPGAAGSASGTRGGIGGHALAITGAGAGGRGAGVAGGAPGSGQPAAGSPSASDPGSRARVWTEPAPANQRGRLSRAPGARQGSSASDLASHPVTGTESAAIAAAPLGLSGADLVGIVLLLLAMVGLSILTARLARRSR